MAADGPVTLLLERPRPGSAAATWAPLPLSPSADADGDAEAEAARWKARAPEPIAPPVYGLDDGDEDGAFDEEAAARRRDAQLRVETPGSEVSAAILSTVGILALLLLAGFSP
jgi:hypothetical protein